MCAAHPGEREAEGYLEGGDRADFARQPIAGKCASCRFWEEDEGPVWHSFAARADWPVPHGVSYTGDCHRRAPLPLAVVMPGENVGPGDWRCWPTTRWDDFCGEHERGRDVMPFTEEGET